MSLHPASLVPPVIASWTGLTLSCRDGRMSVEDAAGLGYEQFLRDEEGEGNQSGK